MCLWWALFESLLEAMSAFPDESRVRELAEQIRARCMHAHQLKLAGQQATATGNLQVCFNTALDYRTVYKPSASPRPQKKWDGGWNARLDTL